MSVPASKAWSTVYGRERPPRGDELDILTTMRCLINAGASAGAAALVYARSNTTRREGEFERDYEKRLGVEAFTVERRYRDISAVAEQTWSDIPVGPDGVIRPPTFLGRPIPKPIGVALHTPPKPGRPPKRPNRQEQA